VTVPARVGGAGARPLVRLAAGPIAFAVVLAWPLPDLSPAAHRLAAVFAWAVVYWFGEALPPAVTALLASVLAIVLGVAPAPAVLAPYADPVIFLFLGSFILAEATRTSGLDRRLALAVLRPDWVSRSPARILAALGVVTCTLSLWLSNTTTTAIMLPVGLGVLRALGLTADAARSPFPIGLLLMLTWSSSVAVGVPVASPPNLIAIGMVRELAGRSLTFVDWMAVTLPLTVVMLALCWLILWRRYRDEALQAVPLGRYVADETARLGPWRRAEANVVAVFGLAIVLWMLPGLARLVAPDATASALLERHVPESAVALLAAVLLFVLPTNLARGEYTLAWSDAARIDWSTILLFGGGLSLGRLMFDTGLAPVVGGTVLRASGVEGVWGLTAGAIVAGVVLSETSSNTAAASVVIPVVIAAAQSAGVSPVPPAIGAALGASFGFMLPVSTPPNAIVYGSGLVPLREMVRSGLLLDLAGIVLIWLGLRLLCPLFGVL
jgi:sodium-dependent dicarboxylate transporter 2/3/5